MADAERLPLAALFLHGGVLALFYSAYVPAVWFFGRYLCLAQLCVCALGALGVARALTSPSAVLRGAAGAAAALALLGAAAQSAHLLVAEPDLASEWGIDGPTGCRSPMRAALARLPEGAVVGALQSGALGYFAPAAIEVVNLDGVISAPAAAALARHELLAYATARGVTHFCDWPLQHELFAARAGGPLELREIWRSPELQKSAHRVQLSELTAASRRGPPSFAIDSAGLAESPLRHREIAMPIVQTRCGRLEGEARDGLCVFRGIPYAAPPLGALRWRAPQPVAPWSGIRAAQGFGPAAPQTAVAAGVLAAFNIQEGTSEDCLYLNVWTPGVDAARRPVMVWIHGGGFLIGSGAQVIYDGTALAKRGDVVVVTLNYRLGALGFLRLAELTRGEIPSTGNEGLLDQVAALEWVHENVAAFGGDPDNVTIFGESAGGMSVTSLLALPMARGLFRKAIAQSGAGHSAYGRAAHAYVAERILAATGAGRDATALRALTPAQLLAATTTVQASAAHDLSLPGLLLQPVVDGEVLPGLPIDVVARGAAAGIPLLLGTTLEEWKLFALADASLHGLSEAALTERLARRLGAAADALLETYRKALGERGEPTSPRDLFVAIETDRCFRIPGVLLAEAQGAHGAPVYAYLFTWKSPLLNGLLGACHALELGFVFGTLSMRGVGQFAGSGPQAEALAARTMDAWIAFARSGDPSCPALGAWGPYTATERATMVLGEQCALGLAPLDEERRAWQGVPAAVLGQP